jgi:hypothetical protein
MRSLALRLLALIAVLLLPLGMAAAPAAAHHAEMSASMPMQHCPDGTPKTGSKAAPTECTMACSAALPAVDLAPLQMQPLSHSLLQPSLTPTLTGIELEIATPPPRLS